VRFRCAGEPDLSKPDTGRSDYCQSVGEVHFEHFLQALAHKCDDGPSSRRVRSKQDYSRMLVHRVALQIGDTFVECEQDPIGSESCIHNRRICRAPKFLAIDRVYIVAHAAEVRGQFDR